MHENWKQYVPFPEGKLSNNQNCLYLLKRQQENTLKENRNHLSVDLFYFCFPIQTQTDKQRNKEKHDVKNKQTKNNPTNQTTNLHAVKLTQK